MPKVKLDPANRVVDEETPNPDLLRKDPMAELFGPGSTVKIIGDADDEIPDEVKSFLDEYGLSSKQFNCALKEIPEGGDYKEGGGSANYAHIKSWVRSIPSQDWIAKNHGPGNYLLVFSWRTRCEETDGISKPMRHEVQVFISEKALAEFKKHNLEKKIQEASAVGTQVRDALIEKRIEGQMVKALTGEEDKPQQNPAEVAKAYIAQTLDTVKMMGIPIGVQPSRTIEWDKILPALITGVTAFMKIQQDAATAQQDQFNKLLMLMLTQGQHANTQLLDVMKTQSGVGSGNAAAKEFKDMLFSIIDIKEALGQKEGVADKIFRIVEGIAPQILTIAASAADARTVQNTPAVKFAKKYIETNPDFKALKENPSEMKAFIAKMDDFFGWRQADTILQVAGWPRPAECPRDPARENPPQIADNAEPVSSDDPTNSATVPVLSTLRNAAEDGRSATEGGPETISGQTHPPSPSCATEGGEDDIPHID